MSKVICDICGTAYQETADKCPICGYARDLDLEAVIDEDILLDDAQDREKGGHFTAANVLRRSSEFLDLEDEVSEEDEDEEDPEQQEDYEPPRANIFLVVILVALITLLLAATGYLFVRYFLPNMLETEPTITEPVPTLPFETVPSTTTEPTIPCEGLVLTGGVEPLTMEGGYWLLHVRVTPSDTTDKLLFESEDESVVTVNEDGRLMATGEGETYVNILCGQQKLRCHIVVDYSLASAPAVEQETIPPMTTAPTEETQPSEEAAKPTEETKKETEPLKHVVLKLKKTDIMLGVGYSYTIPLDCDLSYEEIQWSVEEPYVAKVENGMVTALHSGVTDVVARYGDQVVECRIRCS